MKLTEEEACFFDLITMFGYEVDINAKKTVITKDDFSVQFDRKKFKDVLPIVMEGVEIKHF